MAAAAQPDPQQPAPSCHPAVTRQRLSPASSSGSIGSITNPAEDSGAVSDAVTAAVSLSVDRGGRGRGEKFLPKSRLGPGNQGSRQEAEQLAFFRGNAEQQQRPGMGFEQRGDELAAAGGDQGNKQLVLQQRQQRWRRNVATFATFLVSGVEHEIYHW